MTDLELADRLDKIFNEVAMANPGGEIKAEGIAITEITEIVKQARIDELNHLASFYPPVNKFNKNLNLVIEAVILKIEEKI